METFAMYMHTGRNCSKQHLPLQIINTLLMFSFMSCTGASLHRHLDEQWPLMFTVNTVSHDL